VLEPHDCHGFDYPRPLSKPPLIGANCGNNP